MHLEGLDLNQLRVLSTLLDTRSVSAAAKQLGLSQSATSHALARLRASFGDPLLVRARSGMLPTPRAAAMQGALRAALQHLSHAIAAPSAFDPQTSEVSFRLATADYAEFILVPPLMRRIASSAPLVNFNFQSWERDATAFLTNGDIDLAISPLAASNERPGIRSRKLFDEQFVCVLRQGHPALKGRLTPERFAALGHAFIAPRGQPGGVVDDALEKVGLKRRVALMVPHFLVAPFVIAETDLVLTVPARVAHTFAGKLPLSIVEPPLPLPGFTMVLLWHDRSHADPAHRWLRDLVVDVAGQLGGRNRKP